MVELALVRMKVSCHAIPWQQADLESVGLTPEQAADRVWWIGADGAKESGHRAVAAALDHGSAAARPLGRLIGAKALGPVAAATYDLVARNRHRMPGGTAACQFDPALEEQRNEKSR